MLVMAIKGETYIMSEEHKENIRRSRKGYVPKPITCKRISQALKGHKVTYLTRIHIARAMIGNQRVRKSSESNDNPRNQT
jgi:hypothetical protein